MFDITFANTYAAEAFLAMADEVALINREADDVLLAERIADVAHTVENAMVGAMQSMPFTVVSFADELHEAAEAILVNSELLNDPAAGNVKIS